MLAMVPVRLSSNGFATAWAWPSRLIILVEPSAACSVQLQPATAARPHIYSYSYAWVCPRSLIVYIIPSLKVILSREAGIKTRAHRRQCFAGLNWIGTLPFLCFPRII